MKQAILVDIDGTLADITHRMHHWHSKNYEAFNSEMPNDKVNQWCVEIINAFKSTHKIFLITGRPGRTRILTQPWLIKRNIHHDGLLMEKENELSWARDDVMKRELYNTYIRDTFKVSFVIDDRVHVVEMWRSLGLTCLACSKGDY